jgi:tRNA (cmo5U34)-methyltransferase
MEIPKTWTFDNKNVANAFDAHVREQLPWYDLVTGAVVHLARHFVQPGGLIYDLGASTGNIGRAIAPILSERKCRFVAIESAPEMAKRYEGPPGSLVIGDACDYPYETYDLTIAMLVLMFIPMDRRAKLLDILRSKCRSGGALIVVDRTVTTGGYADTALYRMTLAGKIAGGASCEEIVAKEMSLGGVQRPLETREMPSDFREWFRFGHFKAWVYEG